MLPLRSRPAKTSQGGPCERRRSAGNSPETPEPRLRGYARGVCVAGGSVAASVSFRGAACGWTVRLVERARKPRAAEPRCGSSQGPQLPRGGTCAGGVSGLVAVREYRSSTFVTSAPRGDTSSATQHVGTVATLSLDLWGRLRSRLRRRAGRWRGTIRAGRHTLGAGGPASRGRFVGGAHESTSPGAVGGNSLCGCQWRGGALLSERLRNQGRTRQAAMRCARNANPRGNGG
jgi:hypothetical protein